MSDREKVLSAIVATSVDHIRYKYGLADKDLADNPSYLGNMFGQLSDNERIDVVSRIQAAEYEIAAEYLLSDAELRFQ